MNSCSISEAAHDTVPGLRGDKGSNEAAALDLEVVLLLPPNLSIILSLATNQGVGC